MDAVVAIDDQHRIFFFNGSAEVLFGYRAEEVLGRPLEFLLPQSARKAHRIHVSEFKNDLSRTQLSYSALSVRGRRKDGTEFPAEVTFSKIPAAGGPVLAAIVRDVSAVEEAEEASDLHLAVLESLNDAVVVRRGEFISGGKRVYANRAFRRRHGIKDDVDISVVEVHDWVLPEDREIVTKHQEARRRGEPVPPTEYRVRRPDGSVRTVEASGKDIIFQGIPARLGVIRDVTERKEAEEALRESEELYRAVVENVDDAIVIHKGGKRVFVNAASLRLHGDQHMSEALAHTGNDYILPEDRRMLERVDYVREAGQVSRYLYRIQRKDGEVRHIESSTVGVELGGAPATVAVLHDVTERKQAEEALRESEEAHRTVLDSLNDAIAVRLGEYSDGAKRVYGNSAFRRLHGIGDDADIAVEGVQDWALGVQDWVLPEDRELVTMHHEARMRGEPVSPMAYRIRCPDGSIRVVESSGKDIIFQGSPARLGVIRDVTERKEAEEAVRLSNERLEHLLSAEQTRVTDLAHSNTLIAALGRVATSIQGTLDPDQVMETLGIELHSIGVGCVIYELDPGSGDHIIRYSASGIDAKSEDRRALRKLLWGRRISSSNTAWHHSVVVQRKPQYRESGIRGPLMASLKAKEQALLRRYIPPKASPQMHCPLVVQDSVLGAIALWGRDLRESDLPVISTFAGQVAAAWENARLHAQVEQHALELEREVAERTAELGAIQENMTEGLTVLDSERRVLYQNRAARALLGLQDQSGNAESLHSWMTEFGGDIEVPEAQRKTFLDVVDGITDEPATIAVRILRPPERDLMVTAFPIRREKGNRMVGLLSRDVTEQRAEERRRENFIAVASHELRTPLSVITGFSELLVTEEPPKATRRRWVEYINRESWRITSIVEELLDVSRIQSGSMLMHEVEVAVLEIGEELLAGLRSTTDKHHFRLEVAPGITHVVADRNMLTHVLVNFLSNALKYSPDGGCITLSARRGQDDGRVIVAVADQGIGISAQDQDRIFDSFARVDRDETKEVKGAGLGLYISKLIAEQMHAQVWVESEPGVGSTFSISLPGRPSNP